MNKKLGFVIVTMGSLLALGLVFTACEKDNTGPSGNSSDATLVSQWTNMDDFDDGKGVVPYQTYSFYDNGMYILTDHLKDTIAEEGTYMIEGDAGEEIYTMTVTWFDNIAFSFDPIPVIDGSQKSLGTVLYNEPFYVPSSLPSVWKPDNIPVVYLENATILRSTLWNNSLPKDFVKQE